METISFYKSIKNIKFVVLLVALLCAVLFSCKKEVKFSTDLAIDRPMIRVADSAASARILVYSDGNWNVKLQGDTSWVKLDRVSGSGTGEFIAIFESNFGNLPRAINIIISSNNKIDTVSLQQRGLVPTINITDATANGISIGGAMKTAIITNVPFNFMVHAEVYPAIGEANWISDLSINGTNLVFTLGPNNTTTSRQAVVRLSYLDAMGTTTKDSLIINQNSKGTYDLAVLKDFSYVKTALAAGIINEDIYIEGVIVSDKGNPNMGLNANTATNKHTVDKTENSITSYIQSLDGKSGIRIRAKTGGDNIFGQNEVVKLWLKGVTLKKETAPTRVTLEQVQSINVISKIVSTTPLVPRSIYMKDLTDNDLYTYVKLNEVEISVPSGSFTNINEDYNLRTDVYPMNIRDINGNSMYMLTNIDVLYRRDGIHVPQGSGSISGILVHEDLPRYGTNIGNYAIRHLKREDIDLKANRTDGFSNVLVEWSQFKTDNATNPTTTLNPLTPDIGTGKLTQNQRVALDFSANGIYAGSDYNGLLMEATTVKGLIANGSWGCKTWWDDTKNIGAAWSIVVTTAGITKPISMQIEGGTDTGGPTNFIAEWSTTGLDTDVWNQLGVYTLEDVVIYANTLLTQVPGFKVINFQFPLAASGLNNLYIRLRVKNKITGTATAPTGGTLTATGISRLGHLSIKYNK